MHSKLDRFSKFLIWSVESIRLLRSAQYEFSQNMKIKVCHWNWQMKSVFANILR